MRSSTMTQLVGVVAIAFASDAYAQRPPAIQGVTGTIATEATIKDEKKAGNKIVVATEDGAEHVYDAAKDLVVHPGKNPLADLKPGTTVVIHYTPDNTVHEIDRVGENGLSVTEGIVSNIDRGKKQITIRYDNGKTETLQLTERAAVDAGLALRNIPTGSTRVVVYYSDAAKGKIAHYFKQKK
jgi:phage baseplate assembly protein gpV